MSPEITTNVRVTLEFCRISLKRTDYRSVFFVFFQPHSSHSCFSLSSISLFLSDMTEKHSLSLSPPLTWDLTSCLPSFSTSWLPLPPPAQPFHPSSPLPLPIPSHILSSPPSPSLPPYHLVSTFPYSLPANKGGKKLLLISGWPLPLGHILRGSTWLLTWPSAIKTCAFSAYRPGNRGERPVCIDAWLDVCVTALWQETDRFTNYCTTSEEVPLSPQPDTAAKVTHKGDGSLFPSPHVGPFARAPLALSPTCVFTHRERWRV